MFFASICGRVLPHGSHVCVEASGSFKETLTLAPSKRRRPPRNSDFTEEGSPFCRKAAGLDSRRRVQPEGLGRADPACSAPRRGRRKGSQASLEPPPVPVRLGAAGAGGPGWSWRWWMAEAPGGRCQERGRTASPWRWGRRQLLPVQRRDGQVWGSQSRGWNKRGDASAPHGLAPFLFVLPWCRSRLFPALGWKGETCRGEETLWSCGFCSARALLTEPGPRPSCPGRDWVACGVSQVPREQWAGHLQDHPLRDAGQVSGMAALLQSNADQ